MKKKRLKIAIVGAGSIVVSRHIPGFLADGQVDIIGVSNSTIESAERFCKAHAPSAIAFQDWKKLIAREDIDIVWIGTTPYMHAEIAIAALEAKKHVFCQARMAGNLKDALAMQAAARAHPNLVTMICPPPMGLIGDTFVRNLLQEGVLGKIRQIRLQSFSNAFLDPSLPAHWRQRKEISGQNILTLGIYAEVLNRWLGPIQSVLASGGIFISTRQGYEVKLPDVLDVLVQWENGAYGTLQFSGVHSGVSTEYLEIEGENGVFSYDFKTEEMCLQHGDTIKHLTIPIALKGGWNVEADFLNAVRHPEELRPHPDFSDGVAYMAVVHAVNESLQTHCRIDVVS